MSKDTPRRLWQLSWRTLTFSSTSSAFKSHLTLTLSFSFGSAASSRLRLLNDLLLCARGILRLIVGRGSSVTWEGSQLGNRPGLRGESDLPCEDIFDGLLRLGECCIEDDWNKCWHSVVRMVVLFLSKSDKARSCFWSFLRFFELFVLLSRSPNSRGDLKSGSLAALRLRSFLPL